MKSPTPTRNGASCSRPEAVRRCCARKAPSGRSPARCSRTSHRHIHLRRLRAAAVLIEDQVRQRHRLAELLGAARRTRSTRRTTRTLRHGAHRSALPPMRRPSRPCVRRRPEADRPALLHERRRAEVRARRVRLELSGGTRSPRVHGSETWDPGFRSGTAASRISLPLDPGYTAA